MKRLLFIVGGIVCFLLSFSCTKENISEVEDSTLSIDEMLSRSSLSSNFSSFIADIIDSRNSDIDSVNLIAGKYVGELKSLGDTSFLSCNYSYNQVQADAITEINEIIISNNYDFSKGMQQCANIIAQLPEEDRELVLLSYSTTKTLYETIVGHATKGGPIEDVLPESLAGGALGSIYGGVVSALFTDATVAAVMGGAFGIIMGAAIGVLCWYGINDTPVEGTVVNKYGVPVAGAKVVATGTSTDTVTDGEGHFKLRVPQNSFLVVNMEGYRTSCVEVKDVSEDESITIVLEEVNEI